MAKATNKEAPVVNPQLIYCGPNIPGGALQQFTVFKNGLPQHLNDLFKQCPAIQALCVPVENFPTARQATEKAGSAEFLYYRQIMEFIKKGGKQ